MPALTRTRHSPASRPRGATGAVAPSTPAERLSRSRWRQPRLVIGVLLVTAAVVLGSRVLSALDDSTMVWQVQAAASAGSPVAALDVRPVSVRFDDAEAQAAYRVADQPLPADGVVARDLAPGQLLASADLRAETDDSVAQLPLDVPSGSVPADLTVGDRVDVWVVPESPAGPGPRAGEPPIDAVRVLAAVRVADVAQPGTAVGDSRQLLVYLSPRQARRLDEVLGRLSTGPPVTVRVLAPGR